MPFRLSASCLLGAKRRNGTNQPPYFADLPAQATSFCKCNVGGTYFRDINNASFLKLVQREKPLKSRAKLPLTALFFFYFYLSKKISFDA